MKYTGNEYICQLEKNQRIAIALAIERIDGADVDEVMDGRLVDLEPEIDWRRII